MAHYIVLASFTDQGIRAVKDTGKRAKAFRDTAKKMGATVKEIYWTLGHYDIVVTVEAPSDEVMASVMMKIGAFGNVKSQTLPAFTESQIESIVSKI